MRKPKVDLASHLQKTSRQHILKLILVPTIGTVIVGIVVFFIHLLSNLPWHWQLFIRWVTRGGDVTYIPERLYKEISDLCYQSDINGKISAHKSNNPELFYGLGTFECKLANDGEHWIIRDDKFFTNPDEAGVAGTQIAVELIYLLGTDYSYKIEAVIPVVKNDD